MIAAGYLLHKPDAILIFGVYGLALWCGYRCGRYDERHRGRPSHNRSSR